MTDNKLDDLITEYGITVAKLITKAPLENVHKAKQAILDYVEAEKQKSYDKGLAYATEIEEDW